MRLDDLLPAIALPRFAAFRAAQPAFVWKNPDGGDAVTLDEHAYFVPLPGDPPGVCHHTEKQFAAERYGGNGLGTNGGGARCGLAGPLQIKGIGQNGVAGKSDEYYHSYGGATLTEGILEAAWGEIFHAVLPHGSVRVRALISTGTSIGFPGADGARAAAARTLIVRDAALRPAHYMRSPYFSPLRPQAVDGHDTERTRAAVALLGKALKAIYGPDQRSDTDPDFLNDALAGMMQRFGRQFAAARAKRLIHGSMIASNIGLDGRWLDFATPSALPTWGHIISPRGPDALQEELAMQPALANFFYSLRKYLPPPAAAQIHHPAYLWDRLSGALRDELALQWLKWTGIPAAAIGHVEPALAARLSAAMDQLIAAGNQRRFIMMSADTLEGMRPRLQTGDYPLLAILRTLAVSMDAAGADAALRQLLPDAALRSELAACYHAVRAHHLGQHCAPERQRAAGFCRFNALRFCSPLLDLYRPRLYTAVAGAIAAGTRIDGFIDQLIAQARFALADDELGLVDATPLFGAPAQAQAAGALVVSGQRVDWRYGVETLEAFLQAQDQLVREHA